MDKTCPSCRQTKPYEEFGRNRSLKDGLSFYCLACNRARNKAWYRERRRSLGFEVRDCSWIPDGFRWCPSYRQAVAHEDYTRSAATASGVGSRCRACDRAANSEGYFCREYKLTKRALPEMRVAQGDACAIRGDAEPPHLDHDHGSGVTRQLPCQRCNQGLGSFRDDPRLLRAAAEYVESHRARQAAASVGLAPANGPTARTRPGTPPVGSKRRPAGADRSRGSVPYRRALLIFREADG